MNYDIWGPWSATVGPNAPLNDTCASSANRGGSAVSAVKAWNKAGMPLNQIVLGVAAYGHSFRVLKASAFKKGSTTVLASYPSFDASDPPAGDSWDDPAGIDECGNAQQPGGDVDFWGLVQEGYLTSSGNVMSGIAYAYDTCSQTVRDHPCLTPHLLEIANSPMCIIRQHRSWSPLITRSHSHRRVTSLREQGYVGLLCGRLEATSTIFCSTLFVQALGFERCTSIIVFLLPRVIADHRTRFRVIHSSIGVSHISPI